MEKLLGFFSDNKNAITAIGIVLTLIVSALSLYFSKRNNKALHYVNSITKNRVEWIYKLREYISEFVTLIAIDKHSIFILGEEELSQYFEKVRLKKTNIELLLNYTGNLDSKIICNIEELVRKSTEFYGIVMLIESIKDDDLEDVQKDKLVAENIFARSYVVNYMKNLGFKYSEDIYGLCFSFSLLSDINKLREQNKIVSWLGGLAFYGTNLVEDIKKLTDELIQIVQVYLKFEWNRVKYEGEGKEYYKKLQQFDINELLELSNNSEYKLKKVKRFFVYLGLMICSNRYWSLFILLVLVYILYKVLT